MEHSSNHEGVHEFGGTWTTNKLNILRGYLEAYGTALQDKGFRRVYIDAFAGSGYRLPRQDEGRGSMQQFQLFPELAKPETQELLDGSARIALKCNPPFDDYVFVERNPERVASLKSLKNAHPNMKDRITVEHGNANRIIQDLCSNRSYWQRTRAVLFLDPYGLQVDWETVVAIRETEKIDLWVLFPHGIGVNRMLSNSGNVPDMFAKKLDRVFGTIDWRDKLFRRDQNRSIFGDTFEEVSKVPSEIIARYYIDRLRELFPGVAKNSAILCNSKNSALYIFCFAVGNKKAIRIAMPIAEHLLRKF